MLCPNENVEMKPVKVEAHYGQSVVLDQCPECGGIWFDKLELYSPKPGQAEKVESLDIENLRNPSAIEKSDLRCPRDSGRLVRFQDPFFPKDLVLARCPLCEGFWLNRGEFSKYQNFRQKRQEPKNTLAGDGNTQEIVDGIIIEPQTRDAYDMLGNLGKFLSIPMDSATWRPLEPEKLSDKEQNAINLILGVLTTVLRFFIRI